MKIVVLGADGMLGHKVFQILHRKYPETTGFVLSLSNESIKKWVDLYPEENFIIGTDLMDFEKSHKVLEKIKPDFIINCIGIIKQRDIATKAIPTITLNSLLPHQLADWARSWNGRVVHISTDCVFSGKKGEYTEEDFSDANDLYGRSKYLGEIKYDNSLTLRTSIIGRELVEFRSLLEWFLGQNNNTVHGYTKVMYSGVTTNFIASTILNIISDMPDLHGLYQVATRKISKFDLLSIVKRKFDLNIEILPDSDEVADMSMIPDKFVQKTGFRIPGWEELIQELADDPTPYSELQNR